MCYHYTTTAYWGCISGFVIVGKGEPPCWLWGSHFLSFLALRVQRFFHFCDGGFGLLGNLMFEFFNFNFNFIHHFKFAFICSYLKSLLLISFSYLNITQFIIAYTSMIVCQFIIGF